MILCFLLSLPVLASAHRPVFVRTDASIDIKAEPSQAHYVRRSNYVDFSIEYDEGDIMYTVVYAPEVVYIPPNTFPVALVGTCSVGTEKVKGNSHIGDEQEGDVIYEPFGGTELRVISIIHEGVYSNVSQTCTYRIGDGSGLAPFVVVTGTKETVVGFVMMFVEGLPIIVMQLAAWSERYVYGYFLLGAVMWAWLYERDKPRWYIKVVSVIFLATAINRWSVTTSFNLGLLWSLIPIWFFFWVTYVVSPVWKGIVLLTAIISPTKTWIDVAALLAAYIYEYFNPPSGTASNAYKLIA